MNRRALWCLALLTIAPSVMAYDTQTHAFIVSEAVKRSVLEDPTNGPPLLKRLGLDRLEPDRPFGLYWLFTPANYTDAPPSAVGPEYYDNLASNLPNEMYARSPTNYEQQQMVQLLDAGRVDSSTVHPNNQPYIAPVRNWLIHGAIREDDLAAPSDYDKNQPYDEIPDTDPRGGFQRSFNHFYDPINNKRLHYPILGGATDIDCASFPASGGFCYTSVDWAIGTLNTLSNTPTEDTNRHNHFTWWDARNNYFWALTQQATSGDGATYALQRQGATANRMRRWATTFRSLGDVLHLLGDTAQPQHTRNDPHTPLILLDTAAQQAYEPYVNARVLRTLNPNDNGYGAGFIRSFFGNSSKVYVPDFDAATLDAYPIPQFKRPQDFFTTRGTDATVAYRRGLADYSNKGFFTAGTLPPNDAYALPVTPIDATSGYTVAQIPCTELPTLFGGQGTFCTEDLNTVPDALNPTGYSDPIPREYATFGHQIPLATESEWDEVQNDFGLVHQSMTVMRLKNFQVQSDFLLPRAIAYGAGLVDYFFRGQLTLTSPPGGLFGVIDQGAPHTVDADGYPRTSTNAIFGFTTVRVRVKNTTPAIRESGTGTVVPQTAQGGKLVAVARYHRNPCYQPDLSGEYVKKPDGSLVVPAGCSIAQTRTAYQEISVSAPLTIDANGNLSGTNNGTNPCANVGNVTTGATGTCVDAGGVLGEFDFSADPIPANATDLFLQVVYRGGLGQETDGIAVGMIDLLEPNYYVEWDNSDWFLYNNVWTLPANVPSGAPDPTPKPITDVVMCWEDQLVFGFATQNAVGPGQFLRVGILADTQPHTFGSAEDFAGYPTSGESYAFTGMKRQSDKENGGTFAPEPMVYGRGTTLGTIGWYYLYLSYPTANPPVSGGVDGAFLLSPSLSGPRGPGLPVSGIAQYTSLPQAPCSGLVPQQPTRSAPGSGPGAGLVSGAPQSK